jgi:hypothetical protein
VPVHPAYKCEYVRSNCLDVCLALGIMSCGDQPFLWKNTKAGRALCKRTVEVSGFILEIVEVAGIAPQSLVRLRTTLQW